MEHVSEIWGSDELSRLIWKSRKLQPNVCSMADDERFADDDDFDTFEAERLREERESALAAADAASTELFDTEPLPEEVTREHFVLLPFVTRLFQAHESGKADAADTAIRELRRGVRRAVRLLGMLEASAPSTVKAAEVVPAKECVRGRTALLELHTRKRKLASE